MGSSHGPNTTQEQENPENTLEKNSQPVDTELVIPKCRRFVGKESFKDATEVLHNVVWGIIVQLVGRPHERNIPLVSKYWFNRYWDLKTTFVFQAKADEKEVTNVLFSRCRPEDVTKLVFTCSKISDKTLSWMSHCIHLYQLTLYSCALITDEGLKHLSTLPALGHLILSFCTQITTKGLWVINNLPLHTLEMSNCPHIYSLEPLQNMTKLKHLDIMASRVPPTEFQYLKGLTNLTYLNLGKCSGATDGSMAMLSHFQNLQYLNLLQSNISSEGFSFLSSFRTLRSLNLSCSSANDTAALVISGLSSLESLDLSITKVDLPGVTALAQLPVLQYLNLFFCDLRMEVVQKLFSHNKNIKINIRW